MKFSMRAFLLSSCILFLSTSLYAKVPVPYWSQRFGDHNDARPNVFPLPDSDPDDVYWDNTISSSLPGVDGVVSAVTVYDHKLIVAGSFTIAGDAAAMHIALWDGHSWSALGAGMDGSVYALTVYDNKLIAGGRFSTAGDISANNIAAWDGTSWSALGPGMGYEVSALTVYDNKLIAGGRFTTAGGMPANYVAAWDGDTWSALGAGMNTWVEALTVYDNKLIVGGYFTAAGGVAASYIASWDGTSWSPLGIGMSWAVRALTVYDNMLIAGGAFETAGGVVANRIAAWNGSAWSILGAGMDPTDSRDGGIGVSALTVYDNMLIAGGVFSTAGDVPTNGVAAWDGTSWSALGTGIHGWVNAFTFYDDMLIAGGVIAVAGGAVAQGIAAWGAGAWSALGVGRGLNGLVTALSAYDDELIAAGHFSIADESPASMIAAWDGTSWSPLGVGITPGEVGQEPTTVRVAALTVYGDRLIAGGNFFEAGGTAVNSIAAWDGSSWSPLGSGLSPAFPRLPPAEVYALTVYANRLIAGGRFQVAGESAAYNIAAWDGETWSALGAGVNSTVHALAVYDGKLIAAGTFQTAGGLDVNGIAAWDGTSWSPLGSGIDGSGFVEELTVFNHSLIAGGTLQTAGGVAANRIAAWNGTSWSALGAGMDHYVFALTVYDDKLIAGGRFQTAGGVAASRISAWDGAAWSNLGSGLRSDSGPPWSGAFALTQYHGSLITGGSFTVAGGKQSLYVAEWTRRDNVDVVLDVRPGACPNPINGNSAHGKGKAVLPVAILGTSDFDVRDIDPTSVTLNGVAPVRWGYEDLGTPANESDNDCTCGERGTDGHQDLSLKFYSADIVATLNAPGGDSPARGPHHDSYVVRVEGQLGNGASFEGSDCVVLVGRSAREEVSEAGQVRRFEVTGNYPNPFNPQTTISFYLPVATHVRLDVFDVLGRRVDTLIDRSVGTGDHSVMWDGGQAASGVYYYRLQAGQEFAQGAMLLLK